MSKKVKIEGLHENFDNKPEADIPETLPLLPVRDIVVFPYMILPLYVGREASIKAVNEALAGNRMMLLVAQKDQSVDEPGPNDLYSIGTVVSVLRMMKMQDDRIKILVQGLTKAEISEFVNKAPFLKVKAKQLSEDEEKSGEKPTLKSEALMRTVREQTSRVIDLGKMISPDLLMVADGLDLPGKLADLVASNLGLKAEDAQSVLETKSPIDRLMKVSDFLSKEIQLLTIQEKIQSQVQDELSKSQKDYYLREQMKQIQKELGDTDVLMAEINELREKIDKAGTACHSPDGPTRASTLSPRPRL